VWRGGLRGGVESIGEAEEAGGDDGDVLKEGAARVAHEFLRKKACVNLF